MMGRKHLGPNIARGRCEECGQPCYTAYCDQCVPPLVTPGSRNRSGLPNGYSVVGPWSEVRHATGWRRPGVVRRNET
jgi:hypothetical protein